MVVLEAAAAVNSSPANTSGKKKKNKTPPTTPTTTSAKKLKKEEEPASEKAPKMKKKRSIQFSEAVQVREIEPADQNKKKTNKKEKINKKKKNLVKKIGEKLAGKKMKKSEKMEKLTKKEEREKQKETKLARKKFRQQEDVFDIGVKAKKVWEEVRREDCPEEKKEKLTQELHTLVQGNIKKIIFAHDTVRVVECLMAVGSADIRDKLFAELKEDILEMAKSKYAHFFVQKMLRYGTKEQRAHIFKVMEGNIAKLMKNKTAGYVVELAYNEFSSAQQRNSMLQEFLGPEYRLFKEPEIRTVAELLEKHPEKRAECVKNLHRNVEVLIQKGCFNHSLVHAVIHNFLTVAEPKERGETIEQLKEALVHIIHSREGALAGLQCVWHGSAKDRKAIIKSFKTFVTKIATEEYGHLVLLGIFDQVDDTKLVGKAIIGEIAENFEEIVANKFGVRVIKFLMAARDPIYIFVDAVKLLEQGDKNETSRKERELRAKELREVAAGPALTWLAQQIPAGLYDPPATITFTAIINNSPPSAQLNTVFVMLAEEAAKPFIPGDSEPNIVEASASNMMLKKIILKDKERSKNNEPTFSSLLLNTVDEEGVQSWLSCNRGAFLLLHCYETDIPAVQKQVREKLKHQMGRLKQQKTKGAELLLQKLA